MAKLIYSMLMSLDGYTADASGGFGWARPDDAVHAAITERSASVGTYLYGRKMYETMVFWETAIAEHPLPPVQRAWAEHWLATDKIVYSRGLAEPSSARTRIARELDLDALRRLKAEAEQDLAIAGPTLAAQAVRAGLVDVFEPIVCPVLVGGGTRFFPTDVRLDLALADERRFADGTVILSYVPR